MALQLVIIGLPQSGKTTVFNALTQAEAATGVFSTAEEEPNLATVKVPDPRLDRLTAMFKPRRTVPADVQYYDVAGLAKGIHEQGMSGRLLGYMSQGAALVHVVRAFEDPPRQSAGHCGARCPHRASPSQGWPSLRDPPDRWTRRLRAASGTRPKAHRAARPARPSCHC